jgi:hypothetical protein
MPEKSDEKKKEENLTIEDSASEGKGVWADDIRERGYYYDDSHGYEQFDPEEDEALDDEDESQN